MKDIKSKVILILSVILMILLVNIKIVNAEHIIITEKDKVFLYNYEATIKNAYDYLKNGVENEQLGRRENRHWFCIHNHAKLSGDFKGKAYSFIINEQKATRYRNEVRDGIGVWIDDKTSNNIAENAKFAYIVSSTFFINENGEWKNNENSPGYVNLDKHNKISYKQLAIWRTFNQWWSTLNLSNPEMVSDIYNDFNQDNTAGRTDLEDNAETNADALIKAAETYATNLNGILTQQISNKIPADNINIMRLNDGRIKVGPLNLGNYYGEISNLTVTDANGSVYENLEITDINGVQRIQPNVDFYITLPSTAKGILKISGKIPYTNYIAYLQLLKHNIIDSQNLMWVWPGVENKTFDFEVNDIPEKLKNFTGNIEIYKKVKGTEIPLDNVSFKIKEEITGAWLRKEADGRITYTDEANATEFITGTDGSGSGKIKIENLIIGKYIAYETKNANYGFVIDPNNNSVVIEVLPAQTQQKVIENEQVYIRLSGYVWQDIQSGKNRVRNDYYKDNINPNVADYEDDSDKSFNGISVKLKRKNSNEIVKKGDKNSKNFTNEDQIEVSREQNLYSEIDGGEYIFEYVRVDELSNYYIEFEYDGLFYQSVAIHKDRNSGSKSSDYSSRKILDKAFESVNNGGEYEAKITDKINVKYKDSKDKDGNIDKHTKEIAGDTGCQVFATTIDAEYNINDNYRVGETEEIRYINLGLYEKAQANIELGQDLENVNLGVNGYWHLYKYGQKTYEDYNSGDWNVGVKFKDTFTYRRAIYQADYEYERPEERSKELQVYLTYKITLKNSSSSYNAKVNSIIDYFDNRYELTAVGTGLDEQNNIIGNINTPKTEDYNDEYKKCIIDVNTVINAREVKDVFIQFKLDRKAVEAIINNKETMYNHSEINSYTVYKENSNNETVAVVDINSVPGNMKLEDYTTYEDDTNTARPIQLELKDPRKVEGTIFIDTTGAELKTGEVRQEEKNGIFGDEDKTLKGVEVTLHEINNSIPDMTLITGNDGYYSFEGYVPGQYIIKYTWGDKEYTVQQYKSTIYNDPKRQEDLAWYRKDVDTRNSDAMDDYELRKEIDANTASITDRTIADKIQKAYDNDTTTGINYTKMNSYTSTMEFLIEYDSIETDSDKDEVKFIVRNVDFGIIERARQVLELEKKVKTFKLTLSNGQELVNATVNNEGKLEGVANHMTYMGPKENDSIVSAFNGYIKAEIDSNLIQETELQVGYEINVINKSELDYMTEDYYRYGIREGNQFKTDDILTITPSKVVDYLDKDIIFDEPNNANWSKVTLEELTGMNPKKLTQDDNNLDARVILLTENASKALKPNEISTVNVNISKKLDTSDDLTFDNESEVVIAIKPEVNQHRGNIIKFADIANAEQAQITPSTGEDRGYELPLIIGISSLIILGVGIFIIKKKVIDNK